jgi:hypothetical protein
MPFNEYYEDIMQIGGPEVDGINDTCDNTQFTQIDQKEEYRK